MVKNLQRQIEQEKEKTLAVFNNFADGLLFIQNKKISFLNNKAKEFFLIKQTDCIGKGLSELKKNSRVSSLLAMLKKKNQPFVKTVLELSESMVLNVSIVQVLEKQNDKK